MILDYTSQDGDEEILDQIILDLLGKAHALWIPAECDRLQQVFSNQCAEELLKQLAFWGGKIAGNFTASPAAPKELAEAYANIVNTDERRRKAARIGQQ